MGSVSIVAAMLTQEIVVAGFHRSGTSLLTQLLHKAGLFVGDELIGAMESNPFGHFEDRDIVELHDGILADNGLNWQVDQPFIPVITPRRWKQMETIVTERRVAHSLWGFKDPRVCLFLPEWAHLMPGMKLVGIFRHPKDAIFSLQKRHMRDLVEGVGPQDVHRRFFEIPDLGLRMWLLYNELLARFVEDHPKSSILMSFDAVAGGVSVVTALRSRWAIRLEDTDTLAVFDPNVASHRGRRQPVYEGDLVPKAMSLWERLSDLSTDFSDDRMNA